MKLRLKFFVAFLFLLIFSDSFAQEKQTTYDFTIAFGSCNDQLRENHLWKEVVKNNPDLWIWGGDNVYSDTENMKKMQRDYEKQLNDTGYQLLTNSTEIIGIWDDHDYGLNDGGKEFKKRAESQQLFLDFMGVAKDDARRKREGVYHSKVYTTPQGSIKVILLDTRYFRDPIQRVNGVYKRNETGTILGEEQWKWLEEELNNSTADFNIIMSSIQILSMQHRYEKWANFPNELIKFGQTLINSKAKNMILLSGDRHISEFTAANIQGIDYPLIDFTSSGLTHSYRGFTSERNDNRVKDVILTESFGLLQFDFKNKKVVMQMRGKNNELLQEYIQRYP
jgi:alkaline phosphatase D